LCAPPVSGLEQRQQLGQEATGGGGGGEAVTEYRAEVVIAVNTGVCLAAGSDAERVEDGGDVAVAGVGDGTVAAAGVIADVDGGVAVAARAARASDQAGGARNGAVVVRTAVR